MESSFIRQCSLILYAFCFVKLGCHAQNNIMNLNEGDVCYISDTSSSNNYICRRIEDCMIVGVGIHKNIRPQFCSFIGKIPIVCCPSINRTLSSSPSPQSYPRLPTQPPSSLNFPGPLRRPRPLHYPRTNHTSRPKRPLKLLNPYETPKSTQGPNYKQPKAARSAADMCHEYSRLIYNDTSLKPLLNESTKNKTEHFRVFIDMTSEKLKSKEFPHMVLLGYEEQPIYDDLHCGGSLISKRWVLTAGHCEKTGLSNFATWARIGQMDFNTELDNEIPYNYKIDKRIIHPNYKKDVTYYDDIALFRLERDVQFSTLVRPLCLNTDQSLNPSKLLATIWEYDNYDVEVIANLETLVLNHVPNDRCNRLYNKNDKLPRGIDDTSMLCAADLKHGIDTCEGDSGGPLQISNPNYTCVYTQIGLTSFGTNQCSTPDTVIVYTRISNYISWIEPIVWPKDD